MKVFNSAITDELSEEEAAIFYLLTMQFDSTYRYTDCDIDLAFGGLTFQARGFEPGNISVTSGLGVDSVDLSIDNADLSMSSIVLNEDISGLPVILGITAVSRQSGYDDAGVLADTAGDIIYDTAEEYIYDTTGTLRRYNQPVGVQNLFRGLVNNWELYDDRLVIGLVNEIALWNKKTLRPASASCPWAFKGTECAYSGAELYCDQSYTRCYALGNQLNFGGFRFLPSILETEVWWGTTPK